MTDRPDILDLIDSAVEDYSVSGDAMRCSPDAAVADPVRPYFGAALVENEARFRATFAARADDLAAGLRRMNKLIAATAGSFRQFNETWTAPASGRYHVVSGQAPHLSSDCTRECALP